MSSRKTSYRDEAHSAPTIEDSPLWDLTLNGTYPEDVYSSDAARMYGSGEDEYADARILGTIKWFRNKPNQTITIYRAVPLELFKKSPEELLRDIQKQKAFILKYGKVPRNVDTKLDKSSYFDFLHKEEQKLIKKISKMELSGKKQKSKKPTINSGDWVTIDRNYAKAHGESNLRNKYKIIQKTVRAKEVFTDGNSLLEWGYVDMNKIQKKTKRKQMTSKKLIKVQ